MSINQEYITLPSNVRNDVYFPENVMSHYITKLDERKVFDRNWYVGLAQIIYTYSWQNTFAEIKFNFYKYVHLRNQYIDSKETFDYPEKEFKNVHELISDLNTALILLSAPSDKSVIVFRINEKGLAEFVCGTDDHDKPTFIKLPPVLWRLLGFNPSIVLSQIYTAADRYSVVIYNEKLVITATEPPSFNDINSLFVYADVANSSQVGTGRSNLLRIVEFPHDVPLGKTLCFSYTNIFYYKLTTTEFETIEIQIRDKRGDLIPFEWGDVIIVLDFREILPENNKSNNSFSIV